MSPPEVAAVLLNEAKGVQRNAEAKAWEHAGQFLPDSEGRRYWVQVVYAILEKQEVPRVERRAWTQGIAPTAAA